MQLAPRTVVVSLIVGTCITVVAAAVPARRATSVRPVQALHDAVPGSLPPSRRRGVIGGAVLAAGVAAARQNAMRNPRRTAATASSLMIGMTMVATMRGFATSLRHRSPTRMLTRYQVVA